MNQTRVMARPRDPPAASWRRAFNSSQSWQTDCIDLPIVRIPYSIVRCPDPHALHGDAETVLVRTSPSRITGASRGIFSPHVIINAQAT